MAYQLPKIIGHPGYQHSPDGAPDKLYEETLDQSLLIATIIPQEPQMDANINIYKGRNAWSDYTNYLSQNGITPNSAAGNGLKVVINNITPVTETYENDFSSSELQSAADNIVGDTMRNIAFATGFNGQSNLDEMKKNGGIAGALAGGWDSLSNAIGKIGGLANEKFGNDAKDFLKNPTQKIDIPKMWKGNSFNCTFEITIRLFCFSPKDDNYFGEYILAPLGALLMFAAPKSESGKFYTWPFMMDFKIPGLINIPLAYCSNLTVIKGGDNNDLSWLNRPSMVDIRMSINSVYGVKLNALANDSQSSRPTIKQELDSMATLEDKKNLKVNSSKGSTGSSGGTQSTSRNTELSDSDIAAIDKLT